CRDHCRGDVEGCVSLDGKPVTRHEVVEVRYERDLVTSFCDVCHQNLGQRPREGWIAVAFDDEARPYSSMVGCYRHREEAVRFAWARCLAGMAEGRDFLARGARRL